MPQSEATERLLEEIGVSWEFDPALPIKNINRDKSHQNQARVAEPIDEEQVILYGMAMDAGDVFPPIIVTPVGRKFMVLDGNHRVEAIAEFGISDTTEAYVVTEATELQRLRLTFKANRKNGKSATMADLVDHAVQLVRMGATTGGAAEDMMVPRHRVDAAIRREEVLNRLTALGVKTPEKLNQGALDRLNALKSDAVIKDAARVILQTRLPQSEINRMVTEANRQRTEREQRRVIEEVAERANVVLKATGGGGSPIKGPAKTVSTIKRLTGSIVNLKLKDVKRIPTELREDVYGLCTEAANKLDEIREELA